MNKLEENIYVIYIEIIIDRPINKNLMKQYLVSLIKIAIYTFIKFQIFLLYRKIKF